MVVPSLPPSESSRPMEAKAVASTGDGAKRLEEISAIGRAALASPVLNRNRGKKLLENTVYLDLNWSKEISGAKVYGKSLPLGLVPTVLLSLFVVTIPILYLAGAYDEGIYRIPISQAILEGIDLAPKTKIPEDEKVNRVSLRSDLDFSDDPDKIIAVRDNVHRFVKECRKKGVDTSKTIFHIKQPGGKYSFFYDGGTQEFYIRHKSAKLGKGASKQVRKLTVIRRDGSIDDTLVEIKKLKKLDVSKQDDIERDFELCRLLGERARSERSVDTRAKYLSMPLKKVIERGKTAAGEEKRLYIQARMEGSLGDFYDKILSEPKRYPEKIDETLTLLLQGGNGIAYLHSIGLCHLDVKWDNFFVGGDPKQAFLGDFELLSKHGAIQRVLRGTVGFIDPQKIRSLNRNREVPRGTEDDVYAYAIVLKDLGEGIQRVLADSDFRSIPEPKRRALVFLSQNLIRLGQRVSSQIFRERDNIDTVLRELDSIKREYKRRLS